MSDKTASIQKKKIILKFPYDMSIINVVREIAGRKWDDLGRFWSLPYTPWHCQRVMEDLKPLGFKISEEIQEHANIDATQPDLEFPVGLYPFQQDAVRFLHAVGGRAIIADEMGLGKTIEAIAYARMECKKILVISPSNVLYKWLNECKKWIPDFSAEVYATGKGELGDEDIHIMSYGIMVGRYEQIKEVEYDLIIFDEAHMVKNSKAMRTRVSRAMVKAGIPHVLFLSGTPFMNRPAELFPLLNMLDPVGFASFYTYATRYCAAIYDSGVWYFPPNGISNVDELTDRLRLMMIRRTKRDVLHDLPELTRTSVPVQIENMKDYKRAVQNVTAWLEENKNNKKLMNPEHILTKLGILRQIVGMGKVPAAVELAESVLNDGKKVVLFAHHKEVVHALQEAFKGYKVGTISGDVPPKKRQMLVDAFLENSNEDLSSDSSFRIMIITVAGAEGIDLYSASDIIFVEREWTPAKEEQAESRLHRNGQKCAVNAWYIVASKTVDEKLDGMVREKRKIFKKVIRTDEILETILQDL